jgi:hypothetical protein
MKDIIIVDNFYPNPNYVRNQALSKEYIYDEREWYSTSLRVRYGTHVENPISGFKIQR